MSYISIFTSSKIEEEFYASKIRLNGQKVFKKSKEVSLYIRDKTSVIS